METDGHWLINAGLVTSSIIGIAANAFLLLIFSRRRGLRTVPNRFVINLLLTNLLSSLLLIPLLVVDQSSLALSSSANRSVEISKIVISEQVIEEEVNSTDLEIISEESLLTTYSNATAAPPPAAARRALCFVAQAATSFVSTLSILSILLIGINQYFGVIHSLRYHVYVNNCRSIVFIATAWLAALLGAALTTSTRSDAPLWRLCEPPAAAADYLVVLNTVYAVSYGGGVILAPFAAICVIYVCIYSAAHRNSERMRKSTRTSEERTQSDGTLPKVRSAPNFMRFDEAAVLGGGVVKVTRTCSDRSTNNFITSIKHKISNASVFRYREETRAAKISVLVIFLVLFCYVPYGAALVLNSRSIGVRTAPIFNFVALVMLAMSNVISPFLFGYRNKRVKREIGKVFGLVPPKKSVDVVNRRRSANDDQLATCKEPFLGRDCTVPEVIVTCKAQDNDRKSILKRVSTNWNSYKKCNFITVPESCISGEARGSFSSASTQISNEDC